MKGSMESRSQGVKGSMESRDLGVKGTRGQGLKGSREGAKGSRDQRVKRSRCQGAKPQEVNRQGIKIIHFLLEIPDF